MGFKKSQRAFVLRGFFYLYGVGDCLTCAYMRVYLDARGSIIGRLIIYRLQ